MRFLTFILIFFLGYLSNAQKEVVDQADEEYTLANYDQALDLYREAAFLFFDQNNYFDYAYCNLQMTHCYLESGEATLALSLIQNTKSYILDVLPDEENILFESLLLEGQGYLRIGRNDRALESLLEAEKLIVDPESLDAAQCYNDLGVVYWNNQNREIAMDYHQRALLIRQAKLASGDVQIANSLLNLGLIYMEDEFLKSILYFSDALNIYRDTYGNNHPAVALCYSNLAFANSNQSNFTEAIRYLDLTMDIWNNTFDGDHPNKAFTLSNRGQIMERQGNFAQALFYQQQALQQYLRLYGDKHPEVANSYNLIGTIHSSMKKYRDAVESFQRSIYANLFDQKFESIYDLPELTEYYNADILLSSLQSKAQALEALHFEKSLRPLDIQSSLDTYLLCDDLISQIRQKRLSETDKIKLGKLADDVYDNGVRIALYLSDKTFRKDRYKEIAFNFCERSKSSVLLEAINETKAKSFSGIPHEVLAIEDSLKSQISWIERQLSTQKDQARLNQLRNQAFEVKQSYRVFIKELEANYPNYFELKYEQKNVSSAEVQNALPEGAALVSYFVGETTIHTFLITRTQFDVQSIPKDDQFLQWTRAFRNGIKYRISDAFQVTSLKLKNQLIPEIPKGIFSLIILPDGILGTVPFESINIGGENEPIFLIEKYAISYDYAAKLVVDKLSLSTSNSSGILLSAPVNFDRHQLRMPELPGSKQEVREIRYLFLTDTNKPMVLLNEDASETTMKSNSLANYKFIHLATHGIVNESSPELSRIFLYPNEIDDGSLYSGEIYNLKIDADLVTLSACETGLGKVEKGEGIIGLSRSLTYAGAKNLIVSLWQVSDASTAELMIEFYRQHLHHSGNMIFADDLRKAKLSLLESEHFSDPYFWAPFVLIGR